MWALGVAVATEVKPSSVCCVGGGKEGGEMERKVPGYRLVSRRVGRLAGRRVGRWERVGRWCSRRSNTSFPPTIQAPRWIIINTLRPSHWADITSQPHLVRPPPPSTRPPKMGAMVGAAVGRQGIGHEQEGALQVPQPSRDLGPHLASCSGTRTCTYLI